MPLVEDPRAVARRRKRRIILRGAFVLSAVGIAIFLFAKERRDRAAALEPGPLDLISPYRAIAIAREEAAKRGFEGARDESKYRVWKGHYNDGRFHITFERQPPTPGGHFTVILRFDGKLIEIIPGA